MLNKNNLINYNQAEHKTNEYDVKIARIWRNGIVAICKYIVLIPIVLIRVIAVLSIFILFLSIFILYNPPPILL